MNDETLISIDDEALESVAGGFGLLSCIIAVPVKLVTGVLSALVGGCAPKHDDCYRPKKRGC